MDLSAVGDLLTAMVPFVSTVGIRIHDVERGAAKATLPARREVGNHLGTAHAGAAYTLGETASGAAVLSVFADKLPGAFVALRGATVKHTKAAAGDTVATAAIVGDADALRATYEETGMVDLDVAVTLAVGDVGTAEITYAWAVRAPR